MKKLNLTAINAVVLTFLSAISVASAFSIANNTSKIEKLEGTISDLNININKERHQQQTLNGYIELASNNRMASLISYHLNKGYSLSNMADNGYLNELSAAFKKDYIDDNLYSRMSAFNNQMEFKNITSDEKLIREKWIAHIESGSHFDLRPQGRLILSSESVDIPRCNSETQPYLAYAIAYPQEIKANNAIVNIKEEISLSGVQQYRFVLEKDGTLQPFDTKHRILIDVGCVAVEQEGSPIEKQNDVTQMTN